MKNYQEIGNLFKNNFIFAPSKSIPHMKKKTSVNIYEIDNRTINHFQMLNSSDKNIIREDFILIMEDPPLFKSHIAESPHYLPMHRIVVAIKGTAHLTVNFIDYILQEGDLIVIPANYIVQYHHKSPDFFVRALLFNFNTEEESLLMPTDTIKASIGNRDRLIFDNYFSLLHRLLLEEPNNKLEITSLIISLLHRVQTVINYCHTLNQPIANSSTKKLCSAFIHLVMQQHQPNQPVSLLCRPTPHISQLFEYRCKNAYQQDTPAVDCTTQFYPYMPNATLT